MPRPDIEVKLLAHTLCSLLSKDPRAIQAIEQSRMFDSADHPTEVFELLEPYLVDSLAHVSEDIVNRYGDADDDDEET